MKPNTYPHLAEFISSQQMESSEMRERIISLGKALVEELTSEPRVDTFARWMSHYIAEQMAATESAAGEEKTKAEQECFETILKLWQHRSSLPNGQRPFESFEPIFRALARLDPENTTPYFYADPDSRSSDDSDEDVDEVRQWLNIARGIDQAARVWLECAFSQAALHATDEKTIKWLGNFIEFPQGDDISIVTRLTQAGLEKEAEEFSQKERQSQQEKLKSRIKKLDAFIDFNQTLRAIFVSKLETLTPIDSVDVDNLPS